MPELASRIGVLRRLQRFLPHKVMIQLVSSLFASKLLYGVDVTCDVTTKRGQKIAHQMQVWHNKACRAALGLPSSLGSADELSMITGLKPVYEQILRVAARCAYELYGRGGKWAELREEDTQTEPDYPFRSQSTGLVRSTRKFVDFQTRARRIWNSLPQATRLTTRGKFLRNLNQCKSDSSSDILNNDPTLFSLQYLGVRLRLPP